MHVWRHSTSSDHGLKGPRTRLGVACPETVSGSASRLMSLIPASVFGWRCCVLGISTTANTSRFTWRSDRLQTCISKNIQVQQTTDKMKVKIVSWHAVAAWRWDMPEDEVCGICRVQFDGTCPKCKFPGDDCPISMPDAVQKLTTVHANIGY